MTDQRMQMQINGSEPLILRDRLEWFKALAIMAITGMGFDRFNPTQLQTFAHAAWDTARGFAGSSDFACCVQVPSTDLYLLLKVADPDQDAEYAFPQLS